LLSIQKKEVMTMLSVFLFLAGLALGAGFTGDNLKQDAVDRDTAHWVQNEKHPDGREFVWNEKQD
jgi:hypothetical protein